MKFRTSKKVGSRKSKAPFSSNKNHLGYSRTGQNRTNAFDKNRQTHSAFKKNSSRRKL